MPVRRREPNSDVRGPVVLDPDPPQPRGRIYPHSGGAYTQWRSSDRIFKTTVEVLAEFQAFLKPLLKGLAQRRGYLRITFTAEWIPQKEEDKFG